MKIPDKLKIGAHTYKIILVDSNGLDDEGDWGNLKKDKNEIRLNKSLPQSQLEATFLHEIFHGINNLIDHALMESLSEQFLQVLKDNNLLK